jgi:hypothetical protein
MTTILNPAEPRVQAVFLKGHCRLFAAGMKNSRMTATQLRAKCAANTKKTYKRTTPWKEIIGDLEEVINS